MCRHAYTFQILFVIRVCYISAGAVAFLQASEIGHVTEFTLIELYGGAQLTFYGDVVAVTAVSLVGDDTSYIHIPPQQILRLTEVRKRHNVGQCTLAVCKVLCSC